MSGTIGLGRVEDSTLVSVRIVSECGEPCTVRLGEKEVRFETKKGDEYRFNSGLEFLLDAVDNMIGI